MTARAAVDIEGRRVNLRAWKYEVKSALSVLDGWWIEGYLDGVTGWAIGGGVSTEEGGNQSGRDGAALYDKLERAVLPAFYNDWERFLDITGHGMALNGSFCNTHRMLQQYVLKAYFR